MEIFNFVRSKVDIFDVVSSYLQLKRAGGYFKGPCPFHQEKDASFTVSPSRGIYYCFGCKKGGDAIGFVAELEQINQFEAALHLCDKYKIELSPDLLKQAYKEHAPAVNRNIYSTAHQIVAKWCFEELKHHPRAQRYVSSRGISQDTVEKFEIGYFPSSKEKKRQVLKQLLQEGVAQSDLEEMGLFSAGSQGRNADLFSSFEDRIIFPIKDSLGRYVGFGGRVFLPGDERAKYYNSKETDWFLKKKILFLLNYAKFSATSKKSFILVEGNVDAILMHQHGYTNTVATLGTACSKEQLKMMDRMASDLYVMYDCDSAGVGAVIKLVELSFETSMNIYVVELEPGIDPADQLVSDPGQVTGKIGQAKEIVEYFISVVAENFFALSDAKKMEGLKKILAVVQKIPDQIRKYLVLQRISHLTGIRYNMLQQQMETSLKLQPVESSEVVIAKTELVRYSCEELLVFAELIQRQKGIVGSIVGKDFYPLFSQRMQMFFRKMDEAVEAKEDDVLEFVLVRVGEDDNKWLWNGWLYFDRGFVVKEVQPLLQQLYLQYTRNSLKNCDRTNDLSVNLKHREEMNHLLSRIQSIGSRVKPKGNL